MDFREILTKRPWRRIAPGGYMSGGRFSAVDAVSMPSDTAEYDTVTQEDFEREWSPSGHKINDPFYYPDIYQCEEYEGDDGKMHKRYYCERVPRYSFAFQRIIADKQVVHLTGNDIQFELTGDTINPSDNKIYCMIREGWLNKDMEIAFYESVRSVKITADTAFVASLSNGEFVWKTLTRLNGDTLYPHTNSMTGKLELFARKYKDYDEYGNAITEWVEVWDDTNLYRYKTSVGEGKTIGDRILGIFGLSGYKLVEKRPHGFPRVPISYMRDENGPCWSASQGSIDGYELSFSQMAHNNQAYGEPILVFQGEDVDIQRGINGTVKSISMGADDKVDYLKSQSASESYMKQLDLLYRMIYEQSFAVIPPELKSGDLPAAALKILYSPAYEKAMCDAAEYQPFLNDIVELFLYGYGVEKEMTIDFRKLPMRYWIEPYVHVNSSTVTADLALAVNAGFLSRQTASERLETIYAVNGEFDRIMRETKKEQEADLLFQLKNNQVNVKDSDESTETNE